MVPIKGPGLNISEQFYWQMDQYFQDSEKESNLVMCGNAKAGLCKANPRLERILISFLQLFSKAFRLHCLAFTFEPH